MSDLKLAFIGGAVTMLFAQLLLIALIVLLPEVIHHLRQQGPKLPEARAKRWRTPGR